MPSGPAEGWVPDGGVLLHIGPHKTGTTALQHSFAAARAELARKGVVYPGTAFQHRFAALAVTRSRGLPGAPPPNASDWPRLVRNVRRGVRHGRVVVSAEAFVEADLPTARRVIEELGGDRVKVVMTLRPLAKILPSAWQQAVRYRLRLRYADWLDVIMGPPSDAPVFAKFWHRHRHEEVLERWMSIVGPERIAVVVVDERDRRALPRSFERLVSLPQDTLVEQDAGDNRGLTASEIELVRQINMEFFRRNWSSDLYHDLVRLGSVAAMQTRVPCPDEPRITTPGWVTERANEIAHEASQKIAESGVWVDGDLTLLSAVVPDPPLSDQNADQRLAATIADLAIAGTHDAIERLPDRQGNRRRRSRGARRESE